MAKATATTTAFANASLAAAQKHSSAFQSVGIAGIAIAGGLGFAMKAAADAAISFESTFAGVRKTVDATDAEFEVLAQGIRDMAKEVPVSVEELNLIAETAGQLGVAKEDILGFTRTVADMGATTNLAGDQAASAFARITNIMQTPQGQFDRLGSTIVALGNAGASTESEIVDFALRIAGAGKIAGLSEANILAIGNAMASVGVEAEAGGTSVQKVLIGITQAVVSGSPKLEQFAHAAGMSATQFADAWRTDPVQAFTAFVEGLGMSGDAAIGVLTDLGLTDQRLIRSFLSLAGAGDTLKSSVELGTQAWADNTALATEAGKRYETTASKVAIAGNKINDAAISFGALMLPAIAAVMGAIGDFADLIGGLPGPVRAVALVVGFAAAGMALLAGATLLLLPRLAQVKLALADAGLQAGIFKGSLGFAAKAINPWTLGVTAIIAGLTIWAQKTAEQKARVDELSGSLDQQTGAITDNTRALVVNRLADEGLLDAATSLGISTQLVTDAALGQAGAMAELQRQIDAVRPPLIAADTASNNTRNAVRALEDGVHGLNGEFTDAVALAKQKAEAMGADANATTGAGGAATGATGPIDDLGTAMDETATKADNLKSALEGLAGVELDVSKANLTWLDTVAGINNELTHETNAQGKLTDKLKDGVKTLDVHTEAGRSALEVINSSIDAAFEHGAAVAEETGSLKKGAKAVNDHIATLIEESVKAGISRGAIKDYIDQLNLTPAQVKTAITLLGVDHATTQFGVIQQWILDLAKGVVIPITLGGSGGGGTPPPPHGVGHAGGTIGSLHARRLHAGGNLRADEEMVIGQRGERMLSAREWHALRSITGTGAAAPHVRPSDSGGRIVKVFVRADRRRWNDELDHDFTYSGRWSA